MLLAQKAQLLAIECEMHGMIALNQYRMSRDETIDLLFDDTEFIPKDIKPSIPEEDLDDDDDDDDIDDLIEDDYEDKPTIASIKIDDNDLEDLRDEN